jgi:hypothetical protein
MIYLPSILAAAIMLYVINEIEAFNPVDYQIEALNPVDYQNRLLSVLKVSKVCTRYMDFSLIM